MDFYSIHTKLESWEIGHRPQINLHIHPSRQCVVFFSNITNTTLKKPDIRLTHTLVVVSCYSARCALADSSKHSCHSCCQKTCQTCRNVSPRPRHCSDCNTCTQRRALEGSEVALHDVGLTCVWLVWRCVCACMCHTHTYISISAP